MDDIVGLTVQIMDDIVEEGDDMETEDKMRMERSGEVVKELSDLVNYLTPFRFKSAFEVWTGVYELNPCLIYSTVHLLPSPTFELKLSLDFRGAEQRACNVCSFAENRAQRLIASRASVRYLPCF